MEQCTAKLPFSSQGYEAHKRLVSRPTQCVVHLVKPFFERIKAQRPIDPKADLDGYVNCIQCDTQIKLQSKQGKMEHKQW